MKIGFTGTRTGMSDAQRRVFRHMLSEKPVGEFHHGDCIGADEQAAEIAHVFAETIICHPPVDEMYRSSSAPQDVTLPAKTHFARNRDIVDATELLIATPWQDKRPAPKTGGGTWYTIEYAEKREKAVAIIWPDGSVTYTAPSPAKAG